MLLGAFQHRSGRVISLARLCLALVFPVAIWADPSQPSRYPAEAYVILLVYLAIAAAHAAVTWNDWWLERKLARPLHVIDLLLFGVMVYLTDGYTSPFFTFSVFIILSAIIKWGPRETAATALSVIGLFFAVGLAATLNGTAGFEVTRFIIRGSYLLILSLLLVWFAANVRGGWASGRDRLTPSDSNSVPIRASLEHVAARTGARRVAFLWWHGDEPWLHLAVLQDGKVVEERHRPDRFGDFVSAELKDSVVLFDIGRGRALRSQGGSTVPLTVAHPLDPALVSRLQCSSGLAIPVEGQSQSGLILAMDIPGLCGDDSAVGRQVGREVSAALHRVSLLGIAEQAAVSRTRSALARDLHDSVLQLLAGTSLRLEGIRKSARSGQAVDGEVQSLQDDLLTEQRGVRALVGLLRDPSAVQGARPLCDSLTPLIDLSARQWNIACQLARCPPDLVANAEMEHQMKLLVREAIANAACHGRATMVRVSLNLNGSTLALAVADNGKGFPFDAGSEAAGPRPWSLNDRAHELGGTLTLASTGMGSTVTIMLPWRPA